MGQLLKLSTAVDITILMVDSADHVTGKTGLAAGLTIYIIKAGTSSLITPTVTEVDATNVKGLYKLALTSGHTNTLGELTLHITATGADPTDVQHQVVTDLPGIAQTGDNFARIGAPAGASIAADIAAVKTETATILADTNDIQTRLPAALVGGRMDASVGAMAANVLTASALASDAVAEVADGVWDEAIAGHLGVGSTGATLNAAGGAGDPWATALPGAYGAGTAGKIVGDNLNAPVGDVPTAAENAAGLLDLADAIETALTLRQALRVIAASAAGELAGADTTTIEIQGAGVATVRITADVDSDGNRTNVVLNGS
jgi:hypothetical protein